ncbi:MAG: ThiF family adenylyltransferase [Bacilli bacterium]
MFTKEIELIGLENFTKLQEKSVLIVGIGGVGGTTLEVLVRSGIKNITLIDYDTFDITNLNRQILATTKDINKKKVDVALNRSLKINKDINIKVKHLYLNKDNVKEIGMYDYIIDTCDTVTVKVELIRYAKVNNIKIISCMGTGKRIDPTKLFIGTLNKTYNDPLAKVMRKCVKEFCPKLNIPVVASSEIPLNNNVSIGSLMQVTSTAGIYIASFIINDIIKE